MANVVEIVLNGKDNLDPAFTSAARAACGSTDEATPPSSASITLSVSSCTIRWRRVAPSARRTPISLVRSRTMTSMMLLTPITPAAPSRLAITNGCPSAFAMWSVKARARMSGCDPAVNGTMTVMGRAGKASCASATPPVATSANAGSSNDRRRRAGNHVRFVMQSPVSWLWSAKTPMLLPRTCWLALR